MGIFSKFFAKRRTTPYMPDINIEPFAFNAGELVTPDRSQTYSAVYRATALISQTIGYLPWSVFKDYETQSTHPVHHLLHSRPCKEMSAMCFKESMVRDALLWGNGYAEIEFSRNGLPRALWRLLPSRMQLFRDEDTDEIFYRYFATSGTIYDLPASRIFHLKGLGDGIVGDSIVGYAAKSIAAALAAETTNNTLLKNQLVPAGIITHPGRLSEEAAERLKQQFASKYMGSENAGKPLLMEEGMTFTPVTIRPEDAQFLETRRFGIEEVSRWFGVPLHKLADLEHATFSNIEHQSQEFVNDALMPWCKKLEEEADYKLLRDNANGLYTKIDARGLLRGDNKSRMEYYKGGVLNGIFSINDCRAWEDLPPIDGGDEHFLQAQMIPVSMAAEGFAEYNRNLPKPSLDTEETEEEDTKEAEDGSEN